MRVSLLKDGIIKDLILPNKISGNYWITDYDEDGNIVNLINIEANNGEWELISNDDVFCIIKEKKVPSILIKEYNFYAIKDIQEQNYMIVYCSPVNDRSFCFYEIKSFVDGITIGNDSSNDIVYKSGFVAPRHARISLSNLEHNNDDRYKFIIKTQDHKYQVNANKWGIYVNNRQINTSRYLSNGDLIFIMGLKIMLFYLDGKYYLAVNSPNNLASVLSLKVVSLTVADLPFSVDENELDIPAPTTNDYFHKKPRFINKIDALQLEIDPPPAKEKTESQPLIVTIGPMLTMSISSLVMGFSAVNGVMNKSQTWASALPSIIICVAMFACIFLWPLIMKNYDKKKKIKNEKERQEKYSKYIDEKRNVIKNEVQRQQNVLIESFPTTAECYNTIIEKGNRLWERRLADEDFLKINLGTGNQDMKINTKYPEEHFSMVEDNLKSVVSKLGAEPKKLLNVPIDFSFKENIMAIIGTRANKNNYMTQLLIQLLALHSYDDLKIVVLTSERNARDWEYLKMAPHIFSNDKSIRFFGKNPEEHKEICYFLEREYQNRAGHLSGEESAPKEVHYSTHYLIITDSFKSIRNIEFIKKITNIKTDIGFNFVILNDKVSTLPNQCQTFINIYENRGVLFKSINNNENIDFEFLNYDYNLEQCMKILSNTLIEMDKNKIEQLPNKIGFLQMYEVGKIEQLNIINCWKKNNPEVSLQAPVGYGENGEKIVLDLHEKYHGPHGLIAGMTGSGKSEFIITYILSMAINYHPYEVQFILIDYKGGGLAGAFENLSTRVKLPHLVGTITNLDANEIQRSLASIDSELKRRQRAFNIAREESGESTIDIYKYQRMYRDGIIKEPVSHLFIICDEFAELKNQEPEFMDQLISTARIGRSLGVHLILATQKPSGVVDPQIWSNTRFRVCLRVQEKSDSSEVIKCPDAAFLKQTGRFYFQVGFNEIFELGQAAWAGGSYIPSDKIRKELDTSINFINDIGYPIKIVDNKKKVETVVDQGEELTNLVKYLYELAIEESIFCKPLWLPRLPDEILVSTLIEKYNYQKEPFYINPIIGEYDVPTMQQQHLLTIPITREGNALIYGMTGSGKENMISTMIYSSMLYHTAEEINYYILDFGSEALKMFNNSPIVGDVLIADDEEKINNLFKKITSIIEERKDILSEYNGDYISYLKKSNKPLPSVVVIINNYEAFEETYPEMEEKLVVLSRDCPRYGIYFILTVITPTGVRFKLKQNFSQQFVLGQSSEDDYISILGNVSRIYPSKVFGRGIIKKESTYEFQTASIDKQDQIMETVKTKSLELKDKATVVATEVPVLPEEVKFSDIKDYFEKTNKLIVGINKQSLTPVAYDYKKNRINIITGEDNAIAYPLIQPILLELLYLKETVIFINAEDYSFNPKYEKYLNYCNSDFNKTFEDLEKIITSNYSLYEKNNYDKAVFNNTKPITIVINGIAVFMDRLNEDNRKKFKEVFDLIEQLDFLHFIIIDSIDKIKKIEMESWYKSNANTKNGIWVGAGVNEQFTFRITQQNKELREEISDEFGIIIQRGRAEITKLLSSFELEDNE